MYAAKAPQIRVVGTRTVHVESTSFRYIKSKRNAAKISNGAQQSRRTPIFLWIEPRSKLTSDKIPLKAVNNAETHHMTDSP